MTRRQLLLFFLIGGLAVGGLLYFTGGWVLEGPTPTVKREAPEEPIAEAPTQDRGVPLPHIPVQPSMGEDVFLAAAPENLSWQDPDNPGFAVEIPFFIPWKLKAASVLPLATGDDGGPVGVRCEDVVFLTYRPPENHVEAMALKRGEDDLVLHREFRADEARIFGRLAAKLQSGSDRRQVQVGRDSVLQLSENLHIDDYAEGVVITGDEIRIHPKLGTASGDGKFRVEHDAFVLTGKGIDLHRLDDERTRIEIHEDPFLELQDNTEDEEQGSVVDFGTRDFRHASARAEGRAIVRHFVHDGEERLRIEMSDHVHVTHEAGRSLDTRRLVVVAVHREDPDAPTDARAGGWRLRQLIADGVYQLRHTEEARPGQADVVIITTDVLTHDVPDDGVPSTLLEGRTTITFEGSVPLSGRDTTGGTVFVSCDDRAWIGPIRGARSPQGVHSEDLRRVLLSGNARVEHNGASENPEQDILEGDEIELLFRVASGDDDAMALAPARDQITALEFTARRNVLISGTRMNGSTDLLVARDLSGLNPRISAIGPGTRIAFPNIGKQQRLLGANPSKDTSPATAPDGGPVEQDKETWTLKRLDAEGDLDVVTSLGGPSFGMPTHLTGIALSYDELSTLAELRGAPATIEAEAINGEMHRFSAASLSLERVRGRVRAQGGVEGELWAALDALDPNEVREAFRAEPPEQASALEVETEDRIDIEIVRRQEGGQLAQDQEQWIRISGPLKAELRSDRMTIDRLRANSLSVALALVKPEPKAQDRPQTIARTNPERRPTQPTVTGPTATTKPRPVLSRITLEAGEIVADIIGGHAHYVEASEGVTISGDMGRLTGDRIVLRGDRQTADVFGDSTRKAEAWFYDEGELRNQVQSRQFTMTWTDNGASSVRAAGTPTDRVTATLYNRGEPSRRGEVAIERYKIAAGGPITILRERVDATDVWVARSTRKLNGTSWTEPARLYAPIVEVAGRNLLTAPAKEGQKAEAREVAQIVARGPETYFHYRGGPDSIQIWGNQFLLNVDTNEAVLTGTPTENVKYQEGDRAHSEWTRATIDLDTGLPRLEGPHITLRTGQDPKQNADGPKAPSNDK